MALESRAKTYVCRVMPGLVEADLRVTRLSGDAGLRHYVLRIDGPFESLPLIVRVNAISSEYERAKTNREYRALSTLDGRHAPVLYDFDDSGQLFSEPGLCLAFVDGEIFEVRDLPTEALRAFGRGIADLHGTALDPGTREVLRTGEYRDYAGHFSQVANWIFSTMREIEADHGSEQLVAEFSKAVGQARMAVPSSIEHPAFQADEALGLLHGDLVSANVVWQSVDRFKLIDWEDVRLGDPAEDIAYSFSENMIGDELRAAFWRGYGDHTSLDLGALQHRAELWRPLVIFSSGLWWLERYCRPLAEDQLPRKFFLDGAEERLRWHTTA